MMAGKQQPAPPDCRRTRDKMQDYLDQTLPKRESLAVFLHVRECGECHEQLAALQTLYERLATMPPVEAPADFDARVLAAVPYEAYRAMAPLRSPRVPVLLEHDSLPVVGEVAIRAARRPDRGGRRPVRRRDGRRRGRRGLDGRRDRLLCPNCRSAYRICPGGSMSRRCTGRSSADRGAASRAILLLAIALGLTGASVCPAQTTVPAPAAPPAARSSVRQDSLRIAIRERLFRIETLQDSLKTAHDPEVAQAMQGLEQVIQEMETQLRDLDVRIDERRLQVSNPSGNIQIDFPGRLEREGQPGPQRHHRDDPGRTARHARHPGRDHRSSDEQAHSFNWDVFADEPPERRIIGSEIVTTGNDAVVESDERVTGDVVVLLGNATILGQVDGDVIVVGGIADAGRRGRRGGGRRHGVRHAARATRRPRSTATWSTVGVRRHQRRQRVEPRRRRRRVRPAGAAAARSADRLDAPDRRPDAGLAARSRGGPPLGTARPQPPGRSRLWLLFGHFLLVVVVAVLAMTIIGIPLALMLGLAYIVLGLVALGVVAGRIGRRLCASRFPDRVHAIGCIAAGLVVILSPAIIGALLTAIPALTGLRQDAGTAGRGRATARLLPGCRRHPRQPFRRPPSSGGR